jgi:hypothetical protein
MTIKFAFEKICNSDEKTPKALVSYLDEIFKKEIKQLQEAEITEKLEAAFSPNLVDVFLNSKDTRSLLLHHVSKVARVVEPASAEQR